MQCQVFLWKHFFFFCERAVLSVSCNKVCESLLPEKDWVQLSRVDKWHRGRHKAVWVDQKSLCTQNITKVTFKSPLLDACWLKLKGPVVKCQKVTSYLWLKEGKWNSATLFLFFSLLGGRMVLGKAVLLLFPAQPSHPGQLIWLEPRATFTSKLANLEVWKFSVTRLETPARQKDFVGKLKTP